MSTPRPDPQKPSRQLGNFPSRPGAGEQPIDCEFPDCTLFAVGDILGLESKVEPGYSTATCKYHANDGFVWPGETCVHNIEGPAYCWDCGPNRHGELDLIPPAMRRLIQDEALKPPTEREVKMVEAARELEQRFADVTHALCEQMATEGYEHESITLGLLNFCRYTTESFRELSSTVATFAHDKEAASKWSQLNRFLLEDDTKN